MHVEKQRFGDANFSGGEMILISQLFAVGSPGKHVTIFLAYYYAGVLMAGTLLPITRLCVWGKRLFPTCCQAGVDR